MHGYGALVGFGALLPVYLAARILAPGMDFFPWLDEPVYLPLGLLIFGVLLHELMHLIPGVILGH